MLGGFVYIDVTSSYGPFYILFLELNIHKYKRIQYMTMIIFAGLLRLQQIYQSLTPSSQTIRVETVKRIANATTAIEFLKTLEKINRWTRKFIVLDCPSDMAKEIVVSHVRDVSLGRRTYHYLLSDLVNRHTILQYYYIRIVWAVVCFFHFFFFL